MTNLNESQRLIQNWEDHMLSFCPGRDTAFELTAELIFATAKPAIEAGLRVADIACGYGGWSRFFQTAATARGVNVHFTALDGAASRLAVYQAVLGEENVSLVPGQLLETLPELAETGGEAVFDAAFFGWTAHEIPLEQLEQIYLGIRRILKPDGLFFVADFMPSTSPVLVSLSYQLTQQRRAAIMADPERRQQEQELHGIHRHGGHHPAHHHGGQHRHYSAEEHLALLRKTGFAINEEIWRNLNNAVLLALNPG
ncbi:MAG: class I SAM-dependent methyltransferase [Candidatus Sericytochromatia bacterium]|nr:class I SAM-dependent methyltransferase [Candidatus Sericytochromatia bacterium]